MAQLDPIQRDPFWKNNGNLQKQFSLKNNMTTPEEIANYHNDPFHMIGDYFTGKDSQYREYYYNKLAADDEFKRNVKLWKMDANWNSTGAQLKRWLAAGGTAASFFAQNQAGSIQAPSAPTQGGVTSTAGIGATGIQQLASAMDTGMSAYWNMRKSKAEAEGKELENGKFIELTDTMIAEKRAQIKLMEKQGKLTEAQARQINLLLPYLKGKSQAEIENIKQQTNLLIQQQKTQETQRWIMRKQGKKIDQDYTIGEWTINKMKWEQLFRDTWGIDPSDNGIGALIKVLATGNGGKILNGAFDTILGTGQTMYTHPLGLLVGASPYLNLTRFGYKAAKAYNRYRINKGSKKKDFTGTW